MAATTNNTDTKLKELESSVRELANVCDEDEEFIEEVKKLIEKNEEFEEEIQDFSDDFLKKRIESRRIIENKNKGMSELEKWHDEVRVRRETRHKEELKRVRDRERGKTIDLLSQKKRDMEVAE